MNSLVVYMLSFRVGTNVVHLFHIAKSLNAQIFKQFYIFNGRCFYIIRLKWYKHNLLCDLREH